MVARCNALVLEDGGGGHALGLPAQAREAQGKAERPVRGERAASVSERLKQIASQTERANTLFL